MSSIPSSQEFIEMQEGLPLGSFKNGTISGTTGKVRFDGESTASEKQYKRLASYTPTNGDRVLLAAVSGTYVILGKII